jgi:hypothetical protein
MIFSKVALILASVIGSSDGMFARVTNLFGKKPDEFIPKTDAIKKFLEKNRSKFFEADLGDVKISFSGAIKVLESFNKELNSKEETKQVSRSSAFVLSLPGIIADLVKDCKTAKTQTEPKTLQSVERLIAAFIFLDSHKDERPLSKDKSLRDVLVVFKDMLEFENPIESKLDSGVFGKLSCPSNVDTGDLTGHLYAYLRALDAIGKSEGWTTKSIPEVLASWNSGYCGTVAKDSFTLENAHFFLERMSKAESKNLLIEENWKRVVSWVDDKNKGTASVESFPAL